MGALPRMRRQIEAVLSDTSARLASPFPKMRLESCSRDRRSRSDLARVQRAGINDPGYNSVRPRPPLLAKGLHVAIHVHLLQPVHAVFHHLGGVFVFSPQRFEKGTEKRQRKN